jgi:hypothetical protein
MLNPDQMVSCIDLAIKKDYNGFFDLLSIMNINYKPSDEIYIIKDCLFLTKDLNNLIENFKSLGYNVNKGFKNNREQFNSSQAFLSCLDSDYRDFLFNYHIGLINNGIIGYQYKLARSKFSYTNIHDNINKKNIY